MRSENGPVIPTAGFKTGHLQDVWWTDADDKPRHTSMFNLISKSEGLLRLHGTIYKPGEPNIIEYDRGTSKVSRFINGWSVPNWMTDIRNPEKEALENYNRFHDFLTYLLPANHGADTEWFLDHLASKVQNPVYRGPCVVLTTPAFGSGRGTLMNMVGRLWSSKNVSTVGLSELVDGFSGHGFNDWMETVWITVPEAKESGLSRKDELTMYESLKCGIDPSPTTHLIKHKYGGQGHSEVYSSTIICTNHADSIHIPANDRRFLFIECATKVRDPDYFKELNEWLSTANWCADVWRELMKRDISKHEGFAPASLQSEGRGVERDESIKRSLIGQSAIERVVTIATMYVDEKCNGIFQTNVVTDALYDIQTQIGLSDFKGWETVFKKILQGGTAELKYRKTRRSLYVNDKKCYLRHTLSPIGYASQEALDNTGNFEEAKETAINIEAGELKQFILDIFYELGL